MARTKAVKAEDLVRLGEAADIAAPRSRQALHEAAERGELPYTLIAGVRHFVRSDVETWASLRLGEAAHLAQCHPSTVVEAGDTGEVPSVQLAGARYFRRDDVVAWAVRRGFLPSEQPVADWYVSS
jgi:hypothetical protein